MKRFLSVIGGCIALALVASCAKPPPSKADIQQTLLLYLNDHGTKTDTVKITQIGDTGHGDFDAPGSQDPYWPVAFTYRVRVLNTGPLNVSADKEAEAKVWRDKFGHLKVEMGEIPRFPR